MADNYLERRMEEYRRSQQGAAVAHSRRHAAGLKAGQVAVDYPAVRVLVTDACSEAGRATVAALRRFSCRVAMTDSDSRAGSLLAQQLGAQYHPGTAPQALARLSAAGDPAAAVISPQGSCISAGTVTVITPPQGAIDAGPEAVAAWCLFALHPVNAWAR